MIIDIHGGPEGQVRPDFLGRDNYYLNELGIAMIYPNVRGSTGYGKSFQKLDNGFLREGSYKDINSLLDWIQTQPDLDANKVMITGGSYGGFMTLAVATNYNDRICCSVDVVGPSNLVTFLEHTSGYRQDLRRVEYGDERDPEDAGVPRADRAREQCEEYHQAAIRDCRAERSAGAGQRIGPDGADCAEKWNAGMVAAGKR